MRSETGRRTGDTQHAASSSAPRVRRQLPERCAPATRSMAPGPCPAPDLFVNADWPVVQPGLLQSGPHADGLPLDLVAQLRWARRRSTRLRFERRRRSFLDDSLAHRVERLGGDAVRKTERAHLPTRGIVGPLRAGETDTRNNGLSSVHVPIRPAEVPPPRTREASPMS